MKTRTRITGFTLVEINVAIVLFLIAVVSTLGILSFCTAAAKKSNEFAQCAHLAQSKMAEYLYLNADQVTEVTTPAAFPSPFDKYRYTVTKLNPPGSTLSGFKEIKVTVTGSTGAQTSVVALKNVAIVVLTWSKVIDNQGWTCQVASVIQTSDGGYLGVGYNYQKGMKLVAIKLKADGSVEYTQNFGGIPGLLRSICRTSDGNYVVSGTSWRDISGRRYNDIFVAKLDGSGQLLWKKSYGGSPTGAGTSMISEGMNVQSTTDNGFVVSGSTTHQVGSGWYYDASVCKFNSDGSIAWQKSYIKSGRHTVTNSIKQTSDGGYVVLGGMTGMNNWVSKLNPDGSIAWQKSFSAGQGQYINIKTVQPAPDGGYIVSGGMQDATLWVSKVNTDGTVAWQKSYRNGVSCSSFQTTSDGGYVASGIASYTQSGKYCAGAGIAKLDSAGNMTWQKLYKCPGYDKTYSFSVQQTSDSGYVMGGKVVCGSYWDEENNMWVGKTDANGNAFSMSSTDLPIISGNVSASITNDNYTCSNTALVRTNY